MTGSLIDAMGPRLLAARWVIQGRLTLKTALHLGGGEGEHVDMPVLRDARTGQPLLPGTTLAGALRSALSDHLAGYCEPEPSEVSQLFGGDRGEDDGTQSPLIIFDAVGELRYKGGFEIRDGVAISPSTGIAEDHKKFDFEVLPAGTTFPLRLDLLVPSEADEQALLEHLAAALDTFSRGDHGLGLRRTRGLGEVSAQWTATRYELSTRPGWLTWARADHEPQLSARLAPIYKALESAQDRLKLKRLADARSRARITLMLQIKHDLLVRSEGTTPDAPDVSHLHSGGEPILPGTSLAGVMRAQALRIAQLVRATQGDAQQWVDRLFGPRFEGLRAAEQFKARASRLRVGEAKIETSQSQRQNRVAIDRFTGGVVDGALFDEQPEVGGRATLTLELREPQPGELGLVLLVVKDLLDGRLSVGGTSSVGRGFLTGTATVEIWNGTRVKSVKAQLEPGKMPDGTAAAVIEDAIQALASESRLNGGADAMPVTQAGGPQ